MATLIHHWPLDEGAGSVVYDRVNNFEARFEGPVDSLPQWVTVDGITAVRFPGTWGEAWRSSYTDCARLDGNNTPDQMQCEIDRLCYAISCRVNLRGSSRPRCCLAVNAGFEEEWRNDYCEPYEFLYLGTDGRFYFGASASSGITGVRRSAASLRNDYAGSTDWHYLVGILRNRNIVGGCAEWIEAELWVDGIFQSKNVFLPTHSRGSYSNRHVLIGSSLVYARDTTIHWPATGYFNDATNSNGSWEGDIRDVRIYCGELTPDEINPPVVPTISSIMFSCNT